VLSSGRKSARVAVFPEVLMALALVVVLFSGHYRGLQSAVDSVDRMRNSVHGQNLQ
jgi:hypothetical protein